MTVNCFNPSKTWDRFGSLSLVYSCGNILKTTSLSFQISLAVISDTMTRPPLCIPNSSRTHLPFPVVGKAAVSAAAASNRTRLHFILLFLLSHTSCWQKGLQEVHWYDANLWFLLWVPVSTSPLWIPERWVTTTVTGRRIYIYFYIGDYNLSASSSWMRPVHIQAGRGGASIPPS